MEQKFNSLDRVMEPETISKNGASPKSQMSKRNKMKRFFFIFVAIICFNFLAFAQQGKTIECTLKLPDRETLKFEGYHPYSEKRLCVSAWNNSSIHGATVELTVFYTHQEKQYTHKKVVTISPSQRDYRTSTYGCSGCTYGIEFSDYSDKADAIVVKLIQTSTK